MQKTLPALALFAALTGCTTVGAPPQGPGGAPAAAYMALGTEPGWTLEITDARLNYSGDYGETKIIVPNPGARASTTGRNYTTNRLAVAITPMPCSDGMSDRRYADTVRVTADGKSLQGCGGRILPAETLAGTSWTFVSIGGVPVASDRPTSLQFDGTRISGSAGCNRFTGDFKSDGATLTTGPMASTRMACPGAGMAQENAFFALMDAPVGLDFASDGTLILTGTGGKTAVLKRVI